MDRRERFTRFVGWIMIHHPRVDGRGWITIHPTMRRNVRMKSGRTYRLRSDESWLAGRVVKSEKFFKKPDNLSPLAT